MPFPVFIPYELIRKSKYRKILSSFFSFVPGPYGKIHGLPVIPVAAPETWAVLWGLRPEPKGLVPARDGIEEI
jgi:hypothetical protein